MLGGDVLVKDLHDFIESLDKNSELKNELRKALELYPENDVLYEFSFDEQVRFVYEVIIPFAKEHGFDFNLEDIIAENSGRIDNDELVNIAGGAGWTEKLTAGALAAVQALMLLPPAEAKTVATSSPQAVISNAVKSKKENEANYSDIIDVMRNGYKNMHTISQEYPINEVDGMIFATLAYLPMNCVPNLDSNMKDKEITISEWCQRLSKYLKKADKKLVLHSEDDHNLKNYEKNKKSSEDHDILFSKRVQLLDVLAQCPRYKNIKVGNFRGKYLDVSHEDYEQFAAVTFTLENGTKIVSFRGTDSTLSGWKEDLDLSWKKQVPAQKDARRYLEDIYKLNPDSNFVLTGHSKGGHLAVYSSFYMCDEREEFRDKLQSILNYDGPGLRKDIVSDIDSDSFDETSKKLTTFIPQSSVIGRIMSDTSKGKFVCVYSASKKFFYQHDSLSWAVNRNYETEKDKFRSYEIQPESEFSAGAISMFLDAIDDGNSMKIFLDWIFEFMHNNNISMNDDKTMSEIFKEVFYNYFIRGKTFSEIVDIVFSPSKVIDINDSEKESFKKLMKAVFKAVTTAYWEKHMEVNKRLGFSPELNESIENMVKNDYSIKSMANVVKVVSEKTLSLNNIWKFIKKIYS